MNNVSDRYLIKCKENYLKGITPSNLQQVDTKDYQELMSIAKECIKVYGITRFAGFFQEAQYFIDLWTAHFILEHSAFDIELKNRAIRKIKDYLDNPLAARVSIEEKEWLSKNYPEYL